MASLETHHGHSAPSRARTKWKEQQKKITKHKSQPLENSEWEVDRDDLKNHVRRRKLGLTWHSTDIIATAFGLSQRSIEDAFSVKRAALIIIIMVSGNVHKTCVGGLMNFQLIEWWLQEQKFSFALSLQKCASNLMHNHSHRLPKAISTPNFHLQLSITSKTHRKKESSNRRQNLNYFSFFSTPAQTSSRSTSE